MSVIINKHSFESFMCLDLALRLCYLFSLLPLQLRQEAAGTHLRMSIWFGLIFSLGIITVIILIILMLLRRVMFFLFTPYSRMLC